jgi:hypothetical protein
VVPPHHESLKIKPSMLEKVLGATVIILRPSPIYSAENRSKNPEHFHTAFMFDPILKDMNMNSLVFM